MAGDEAQKRADHNQARRVAAIMRLEKLLALACHPAFRGEVSISISARDGYLHAHKAVTTEFEN